MRVPLQKEMPKDTRGEVARAMNPLKVRADSPAVPRWEALG